MTPEEKASYFTEKYGDKTFKLFDELFDDCEDFEEFKSIINVFIKSFFITKIMGSVFKNAK